MTMPSIKTLLVSLLTLFTAFSANAQENVAVKEEEAALSSIYLKDSVDVISTIDFNNDSKQNINVKIIQAQILLEKAKKNLKMNHVGFTEITE